LGGEKVRWSETAKRLHGALYSVTGDILLAAGAIAYLGPFTVVFRQVLIHEYEWKM
jgi:dynein heavy chain